MPPANRNTGISHNTFFLLSYQFEIYCRIIEQRPSRRAMRLSIQLLVIVNFYWISASNVQAENVIRYLFNDGDDQSGLECTPAEIKMISTLFEAINTPSNLRKRNIELPERLLESKADTIHQIDFEAADFAVDEVASNHMPSCDDKCVGYRPDQCMALGIKDIKERRQRDLQLSTKNFTSNLDVVQKTYPPSCKSKCAGQVDDNCMGVAGCQGYRRDLNVETLAPTIPEVPPAYGGTYPPQCRDRCRYYPVGLCREPGCVGYRRALNNIDDEEDRDLLSLKGNFSQLVMDFGTYPPKCKTLCAGQTDNMCAGVPECRGYRRDLNVGTLAPSAPDNDDDENQRFLADTNEEDNRDLLLIKGNFTAMSRTYPPQCKTLCAGQVDNMCAGVPECRGYRRDLNVGTLASSAPDDLADTNEENNRDLLLIKGNFTAMSKTFPPNCKTLCAGQVDNMCAGVPGCQGYRRALHETEGAVYLPPADWCVKASQAIDQQLHSLSRQLSPQCRALIQAPRRKECYNDAALCDAQ
jgi:hypothetical protein